MKKSIIKFLVICICLVALAPKTEVYAADNYWYAKRNREHRQPKCEPSLEYIERYGGVYVDGRYGDGNAEKVIYLTFDAGYENGNVEKILDVMSEENVKGSFFILGHLIDSVPELVKRMAEEGHCVCNHTLTHKNLTKLTEEKIAEEITSLANKYKDTTGREMSKFFRPPEGTFNETVLKKARELGYRTVFWSFAYADWDNSSQMAEDVALKKITDNLHNGEIMLLHPTSETNVKIMKQLITLLKEQGYRFATLDEL